LAHIVEICNNNKLFNNILSADCTTLNKIINIDTELNKTINYMGAYTAISAFGVDETKALYVTHWGYTTRLEIIDRLKCLINHFGKSILRMFNIEIITYDTAMNLDMDKLIKYYSTAIRQIKYGINECVQLCSAYIEMDRTYIIIVLTLNHNINPTKYDLVIQ
jgi:hypothetical protein